MLKETYGNLMVSIGEAGRLELPVGSYTMEVRSEEAATTPAAAIQGIKPCHKPASKAPGLIKSLATSAAKAAGGI